MEQANGVVAPTKRPTISKKRNSTNTLSAANGSQPNTPSPVKRRKKGEGQVFNNSDAYCWLCHREGKVYKCSACPRVFHTRCLGVDTMQTTDWVCTECAVVLNSENVDTRSKAMKMIGLEQLCTLLRFALNRMKHAGDEAFLKPVSLEEFPSYADFVYQPMDLSTLEKNIRNKMYGSTESFLSDAKWIVHNCIIFNGYQHRLTSSAKSIIKVCRFEMNEIEVCPFCYLNSYVSKDNWFCDPCQEPHVLVWAKLKGFPYWPAKAMRVIDNNVDVRFFGAHDRAWIPVNQCFLLCRDIPTASKNKKKGSFEQSMEELDLHIQRLQERFGPFQYAPFRTPINPDDLNSHLTTFLTRYKNDTQLDSIDGNRSHESVCVSLESNDELTEKISSSVHSVHLKSNKAVGMENKKLETAIERLKETVTEKSEDEMDLNDEQTESQNVRTDEESEENGVQNVVKQTDDIGRVNASPAKKESAFVQKLDRTIESCKAKLGIDEIGEEIACFDESSDEDAKKQDAVGKVEENAENQLTKLVKSEKREDNKVVEQERTDLDMECSDDGDLVIDLNAQSDCGDDDATYTVQRSTTSRGSRSKSATTEKRTRKCRSRLSVTDNVLQKPTTTKVVLAANQLGASSSNPHTLPIRMPMPALQSRSLVTAKGMGQVAPPSSPGPGCDMNKYSRKMMDFMRGTVEEMFRDMASSGNLEAKVKTLQLEIEKLQWRHQQELAEIKHNADLILLEMRASMESEKVRALTELKRQCEEDKQKAIEETKKKQWCANCGKDAIFYCCWNTSYCDFSCQSAHWPQHMSTCTQSQGTSENEDVPKVANCSAVSIAGPTKLISSIPPNQMQRTGQVGSVDGRNYSANNRREEIIQCHELWSRKHQDDSSTNLKRHEDEQRERDNKHRHQSQIQMTTNQQNNNGSLGNQYSNTSGGPVQYIPSNAVQVIPQTSSLANSSALQVQYVTNSPRTMSLSSPVTTTSSSSSPFASAFSVQQSLCHQSSNQRTSSSSSSQSQQRSLQGSNPMYPIIIQPDSQFGGVGNRQASSPPGAASHSYPHGPYIPGKPYHLS